MYVLRLILILGVVSILATVVLPPVVLAAFRPDLFVVAMVFLALRSTRRGVLPVCWLTGLVADLVSAGPMGAYGLLYLASGMVILRIRAETEKRPAVSYVPYALGAAFAIRALYRLVSSPGLTGGFSGGHGAILITSSVATAIAMAPCAWALARLDKRLGIQRGYHFGST